MGVSKLYIPGINEGNNMSYLKIWIHLVWSTKNRQPLITGKIKKPLINHILENANSKGIILIQLMEF